MEDLGVRVVIFTCNWNAHKSLQEAGERHLNYPSGARPLMVNCLGQISSSMILKAFEKGADGVMLVGCSPEECHYEFGSRRAAELFEEVRELARLLGFHEDQLQFYQVHAGEGAALVQKVRDFVDQVSAWKEGDAVKEVLVVGGGIAGIQAALDLAEQGLRVHVVERLPSIGGRMAQLDKTFPTNDCSTCILSPKMADCSRHPNVILHTYSELQAVRGEAGAFRVQVLRRARYVDEDRCTGCGDCARKCPRKVPDDFNVGLSQRRAIYLYFPQAVPMVMTIDPEHCTYLTRGKCGLCQKICQAEAIDFEQEDQEIELEVGAIVVATGYDFYDPTSIGQYHYHRYPNVITALEFERLISASGPTGGHLRRPSDGQPATTIGFVQCAGSRHVRHNRYCSTVCCVHSTKEAVLSWEHDHDARSYIFYTDLRGSGKGFREYMDRAEQEYQVTFVHGRVAQILQDEVHNPIIKYEDASTLRPQRMAVDLAVLATSLVPRADAPQLASVLGIELDEFGFVRTAPFKPTDTSRPGIYACGCCLGPADIPQSVAQASAAAARAAEIALG